MRPSFNEADNILNVVDDIDSYIENTAFSKFYDFNVIFYNDGSTDNTSEIIQNNSSHRLISSPTNKGLGHAIDCLFFEAKKLNPKGVIKLDGDNQMNVNEIDNFLNHEKIPN